MTSNQSSGLPRAAGCYFAIGTNGIGRYTVYCGVSRKALEWSETSKTPNQN